MAKITPEGPTFAGREVEKLELMLLMRVAAYGCSSVELETGTQDSSRRLALLCRFLYTSVSF